MSGTSLDDRTFAGQDYLIGRKWSYRYYTPSVTYPSELEHLLATAQSPYAEIFPFAFRYGITWENSPGFYGTIQRKT
jgi:hypothetical protein